MKDETGITAFSHTWWAGLFVSCLVILFVCLAFRLTPPPRRRMLAVALGVIVLLDRIVLHLHLAFVAETWALADSLPLHLCRVAYIITGIALLTRSQLLCEWALYLGVPSGFHAIVTPELMPGTSLYLLLEYYGGHSLLVAAPIVMSAFLEMRPRRWAAVYAFAAVHVLAAVVYPINVALDANYMYLARRPMASNPFLIGPWPWYLLGLELACVLHLWVMDILFRVRPYKTLVVRNAPDIR